MRTLRACTALVALSAGISAAAHAQSTAELLARGIRASSNLEYDSAAVLLRAALGRPAPSALPDTSRVRALMYLGATEFFRNNRDSATAAFRRLLLIAPRFRPDLLIFPPEVSSLFEEVRIGTPAVAVSVAPVTDIRTAGDRLSARLYAAGLHMITASIVRPGGRTVRTLYTGAIGDSLEVLWDGRDSLGVPADSGSYLLRVASRGQTARVVRVVEMPLEVRAAPHDTLPLPPPIPDSLLLPEHAVTRGSGTRPLLAGLGATVAAIVMPAFVGGGDHATAARFVVGTATGIAGVIGFTRGRQPQPIPANIAANQVQRLAWQRRADAVRSANAERRRELQLVIRAGAPRTIEMP
jgi:hypothetical protein